MKKRLFIIGAGGFGRQLETYLEMVPEHKRDWELVGYIDDDENALKGLSSNLLVLGDISSFKFRLDDLVLLGFADIESKIKVVKALKDKVDFFTFISDDVLVGHNVSIGKGSIICPGAKIGSNVQIGDFVLINLNTIVGHDSIMGDYCSIMPHVDIGGGCVIGEKIFMGTKATVAPYLKVISNSYLGVGSVIIKEVAKAGKYFGNPARRML